MNRVATKTFILGMVCAGILALPASRPSAAPDNDATVLQLDKAYVQTVARHDQAALGKVLDKDFLWTDASGETLSRPKVLAALPVPMMDDENGAEVSERSYGEAAGVQVANGKQHGKRLILAVLIRSKVC